MYRMPEHRLGRLSAAAVVASVTLSALTGLASAKSTVTIWTYSQPRYNAMTQQLLAGWQKKYPDLDIKVEMIPGTGELLNKLAVVMGTDAAPDIVDTAGTLLFSQVVHGGAVDLAPYIQKDPDTKNWFPHLWDEVRYPFGTGKGLYALPYEFVGAVLLYNKDMFDESGLAYPTENWTWDNLRAAARRLARDTNADGAVDVWGYTAYTEHIRFDPMVRSFGGEILSEDRKSAAINSPAAEKALQLYVDMIQKDRSTTVQASAGLFLQGKSAMALAGSWELRNAPPQGLNYGIEIVPKGPVSRSIYGGANVWEVIKRPKQDMDAVWKMLKELTSAETVKAFANQASLPAVRTHLDKWDRTPLTAVLAKSAPYMKDGLWTPDWSLWQAAKNTELVPVLQGTVPVKEGLQRAADAMNKVLAQAFQKK